MNQNYFWFYTGPSEALPVVPVANVWGLIDRYSGVAIDPVTDHYILCCMRSYLNKLCLLINLDKLTSDKPVVLSHLRGQIRPRWWELTLWAWDACFRSLCYCAKLGPRLQRESHPLMENYCMPLRTYNCVEYGSANLDLCTRQNEALCPKESYFGIVISTQVDSD